MNTFRCTIVFFALVFIDFSLCISQSAFKSIPTSPTTGLNEVTGISISPKGDFYAAGMFRDSNDFGGINVTSLSPSGWTSGYLAKYDALLNLQWVRIVTQEYTLSPFKNVEVDSKSNIIVSGSLTSGPVDFGGVNITSSDYDSILAKYSPDNELIWVKRFGIVGYTTLRNIAVGPSNTIAICIEFSDSITLGGAQFNSTGSYDVAFAKFDSDGNHLFSFAVNGSNEDYCGGVGLDSSGNLIGALKSSSDDMVIGGQTVPHSGNYDIVLLKYSSSGVYQWYKVFGTGNQEDSRDLVIDSDDNIIFAGIFTQTLSFGGPNPVVPSDSDASCDVYLVKLNSQGGFIWQAAFGAAYANDYGEKLDVDSHDSIYLVGSYFEATNGSVALPQPTYGGAYLVKFLANGTVEWTQAFESSDEIDSSDDTHIMGVSARDGVVGFGCSFTNDINSQNSSTVAQSTAGSSLLVSYGTPDDNSSSSSLVMSLIATVAALFFSL